MLEWLKDLVRPIRITDPRFGQLRYLRAARFWEGRVAFPPIANDVEILIDGEPSGPMPQQRAFFDELQTRYESLWPELQAILATEARRLEIDVQDFVLVCLTLPAPSGSGLETEWDLSYETNPRSWHFMVQMRGWLPAVVVAEC